MSARDIQTVEKAQSRGSVAFRPLTVLLLCIIGLMSFGAFISLSGFQGDLERKDYTARSHALSKSPNGFAGIYRLMRTENETVGMLRSTEDMWSKNIGQLIVTLPSPYSGDKLERFDLSDTTIFVLPKWRTVKSRKVKNGVIKLAPYKTERLEEGLEDAAGALTVSRDDGVKTVKFDMTDGARDYFSFPDHGHEIDSLQSFAMSSIEPILSVAGSNGKDVIFGRIPDTNLLILSDPDLINNAGLKEYESAATAFDILTYMAPKDQSILFDLTLHGLGSNQNLVKTMLTPPFLAATLCLLATGLMLAWRAFTRFGRPRVQARVYASGKQALADNSADMIRLAGREQNMAPGYAALIRKLTASALGLPKTLSEDQATESLDRMAVRSGIDDALSDMTHKSNYTTNVSELMNLARRLHKWRQEMTHDRK